MRQLNVGCSIPFNPTKVGNTCVDSLSGVFSMATMLPILGAMSPNAAAGLRPICVQVWASPCTSAQARIERTSAHHLAVNYGTLYPALLKLEQEGYVSSAWGVSDNNRRAKYYRLTRAGRKQVEKETREWERTTAILARFLQPEQES